jgi:predicted ATPase
MEKQLKKNNYFILTGAMGAGKSTILQELIAHKFMCIEEPARPIIAEQRSIDGDGIYDKDKKLFLELMLSRAIFQFKQMQNFHEPIVFDRGIADNIGYSHVFGLDLPHIYKASEKYKYNNIVFFTPGWKDIYQTDDERKMSFEVAKQFGDDIKNVYLNLGYKVVDVPFDIPEMRAKFIINTISDHMPNDKETAE